VKEKSRILRELLVCSIANLVFLNPDFHILAFFEHTWLFGKSKLFFELPIHYKSLRMRVCDYAGCKEYCKYFTVALKSFDVYNNRCMTV